MPADRRFHDTVSLNQQLFAKLLAGENLTVTYSRVPTAAFNVDTRTLILPMYELSDAETSMLLAHEVGHALFTPDSKGMRRAISEQAEDLYDNPIFARYVNIVEDARIERLMKRRYPGLSKVFANGYRQIITKRPDIFGFEHLTPKEIGEKVSTMLPADRVNLAAKIGALIPMKLNPDETEIYKRMMTTETFEEVVTVSRDLWEMAKQHQQEQQAPTTADEEKKKSILSIPGDNDDGYDDSNEGVGRGQATSTPNQPKPQSESTEAESAPDAETQRQLDDYVKESAKSKPPKVNRYGKQEQTAFLNADAIDPNVAIIPFDKVWASLIVKHEVAQHRAWRQSEVTRYKQTQGPMIAYMASEFMRRQSAKEFRRVAYAKTGSINPAKLARYLVTEDIFLQQMIRPEGKKHGAVLLLDGSSSMDMHMTGVLDQTLNMMLFGRHVNIPVQVFMFHNAWNQRFGQDVEQDRPLVRGKRATQQVRLSGGVRLLELANSTFTGARWQQCLELLLTLRKQYEGNTRYRQLSLPPVGSPPPSPVARSGFSLGGTPLYQGMYIFGHALQTFRKQTNIEKLGAIVLTDGEDTDHIMTHQSAIAPHDTMMDEPTRLLYPPSQQPLVDRLATWLSDISGASLIGVRLVQNVNEVDGVAEHWIAEDKRYRATTLIQRAVRERGWGEIPHLTGFKVGYVVEAANKLRTGTALELTPDMSAEDIQAATRSYHVQRRNAKQFISHFIEQWA